MEFLKNITVSKIIHATTVAFKTHEKSKMNNRKWCGLAIPLSGELTYIHNSKKIRLEDSLVVFLPQNATYEVHCTKGGSFAVINFLADVDVNEFFSLNVPNIDLFKRKFASIQEAFNSGQKHCESMSLLYKIFSLLTENFTENKMPSLLKKALDYIEESIALAELSNNKIAEHIGISEVYLRKLFSKNLSLSVNRYILNKRIEKAERLLSETPLSVTEISEKCGYSCIYYFCRSFKEQTGRTPTAYRNENSYKMF